MRKEEIDEQEDADLLRGGLLVGENRQAHFREFDGVCDALVVAYDPNLTPEPELVLVNHTERENILLLNGTPVARFHDTKRLRLSDVILVPQAL